jgi:hypothetical protein
MFSKYEGVWYYYAFKKSTFMSVTFPLEFAMNGNCMQHLRDYQNLVSYIMLM